MKRPLGITIICILGFIGVFLSIVSGIAILSISDLMAEFSQLYGAMTHIIIGLSMIFAAIEVIGLYWLWNMLKKGWFVVITIEIIGIVFSLVSFNIIGVLIPAVIVYYLYINRNLFKK